MLRRKIKPREIRNNRSQGGGWLHKVAKEDIPEKGIANQRPKGDERINCWDIFGENSLGTWMSKFEDAKKRKEVSGTEDTSWIEPCKVIGRTLDFILR